MDIFLSVNNREQVLKIPVLPSEFTVSKPQKNEVFETINQGELKLLGLAGLKSIAWSSFFPIREYSFLRDRAYKGFEYAYIIDKWIEAKIPIRLVITDTPINIAVTVDSFEYNIKSDGDLYYSITFGEFRFVEV